MRCASCDAENGEDHRFCMACGTSLLRACNACAFVNPPAARFCGSCGTALTQDDSPPAQGSDAPEGSLRPVVILFADICDYTGLTARLGAEATHALLGRFFEIVDGAVERYGGTIDKHIGDCAMAVFGAPVAHSNDPERAVRAALDIIPAVGRIELASTGRLHAHVGIASGQVVASSTGSDRRRDYTVTGESVNLAARLLDRAESDEVLVSEPVYEALANRVEVTQARTVHAKGFPTPVPTRVVRGFRERTSSPIQPLVGRHAEIRQLEGMLDDCLERGIGTVALVRGDAGIGKTRLIEELREKASARDFVTLVGINLDFGAASGHDAVGSIIRSALGIAHEVSTPLAEAAAQALGRQIEPERIVFLHDLLDVPQPAELRSIYDAMDIATRAQGRREMAASVVHYVSEQRPLLIWIEDVHWADPEVLGQLATIASTVKDCPIVLVMTTRHEGDAIGPAWHAEAGAVSLITIDLGPLRREEAAEMARLITDPSEGSAAACIDRAAGNPLFLEQLLRNAEQSARDSAVPASLQAVMLARVDRLPGADRAALRAASILGQRFSEAALRYLIGNPDYRCDRLVDSQLVRPVGSEFLFGHALLRDGVYSSLLRSQRAEMHARAAGWFAGRDLILHAEHLDRAGDPSASRAYLAAAEAEAMAYRVERALQLVERGLEIGESQRDRFELTCRRGSFLQTLGNAAKSVEAFEAAVAMAADDVERCRAWIGLAGSLRVIDRHEQALDVLNYAAPIAEQHGMTAELSSLCHLRGNIFFTLGKLEHCGAEHQKALDLARRGHSAEQEARAMGGLADASYARGQLLTAFERFSECIALAQRLGLGQIAVVNQSMLPFTYLMTLEPQKCVDTALEAIKAAARVGNARAETIGHHCAHQAFLLMAEIDAAQHHAERAYDLALRLGSRRFEAEALLFHSEIRRAEGKISEAYRVLREALDISRTTGMSYIGASVLGGIAVTTASPDERETALSEGQELLEQGSLSHNHFWFYRDAIDCCLLIADWSGVERYACLLERYTSSEPLPWSKFVISRGRALARCGQGQMEEGHREGIRQLRLEAINAGIRLMLPALEEALEENTNADI